MMVEQLKKAYIDRVVRHGFEDSHLYNDELFKLTNSDLSEFDKLKEIIGATKAQGTIDEIIINNQGLSNEEHETSDKPKKKTREQTEEEKQLTKEEKRKEANRKKAISILRGISIRLPLLIYGAGIPDDEITIDNITDIVDDASWDEFMPKGVTKTHFKQFKKYYDADVFRAAGKKIRALSRSADKLSIEDRVLQITEIFRTFRNPDKETVLTPWKTVNMHLGDCIGGYVFYDESHQKHLESPVLINHDAITRSIFSSSTKILEINSKSGLYPLYIAYSLYKLFSQNLATPSVEEQYKLWDKILRENIFVLCKTPMAESIVKRTLSGYRSVTVNTAFQKKLLDIIDKNPDALKQKIYRQWHLTSNGDIEMKFNAIIGNPPYQLIDGGGGSSAKPIYHKFVDFAKKLEPDYISMIMPSRWMTGGKGLDNFRLSMMADKRLSTLHDYLDSRECFKNVAIEGGVCYFLWDRTHSGNCEIITHTPAKTTKTNRPLKLELSDIVIRIPEAIPIVNKVLSNSTHKFSSIVSSRDPFKIKNESRNLLLENSNATYRVFCRINGTRQYRSLASLPSNDPTYVKCVNGWKVFISKADGAAGQLGNPIPARIIGSPTLGEPNSLCSETFLFFGPFNSQEEAKNAIIYSRTRFFRYLVGVRKLKNMTAATYSFVPLEDLTSSSPIPWGSSLEDIDNKLFKKYKFTQEEIQHINNMIEYLPLIEETEN